MADLEKTVAIIFSGVDDMSKSITTMSRSLDSFGDRVVSATQPLADMATNILKIEAALAAMAIGGLAYAYNESIKFESAVIELKKVIGDEIGLLDAAAASAIEFSTKYGESATATLASTAEFKQAGFDVAGAMLLTKNSLDLVIAGELEAATASEILVAILKGFKAPAEDAARIVDILNEVSNRYATDVRELGTGMATLSPIAKQMGFSFEETAGILTPVIEVFRSGDEAATALKTGLLKLIDDSKPVREALESIGVSQINANGALRSGKDILFDVSAAFVNLNDDQKLFITQQLVGINQAARMVEVFDGLSKTAEINRVAMNAAGSAAEEVAARLESSEVAINRFKVGFQNLSIIIGTQFKDAAKEAIDGGTEIENVLRNLIASGTFAPVFDHLSKFSRDLAKDLRAIAKAMPEAFGKIDFSDFIESIDNLGGEITDAFNAFFGDIDLTTPEGLSQAMQKIVDSVSALTNVTSGIVVAWKPFLKVLGDTIDKFIEAEASTHKITGKILGFGDALNTVFDNIGMLTGALNIIAGALSLIAGKQLLAAIAGLANFTGGLSAALAALNPLAKGMLAFGAGWGIGTWLTYNIPIVNKFTDSVWRAADAVLNFTGTQHLNIEESKEFEKQTGELVKRIQAMDAAIKHIPEQKTIEVKTEGEVETVEALQQLKELIGDIPDVKSTAWKAEIDIGSFEKIEDVIIEYVPDSEEIIIRAASDNQSFEKASAEIDEKIPHEKLLEIKLKGDIDTEIAQIKALADTVQLSVEWNAKLNIAEIEANAKVVESAFETIQTSMDVTGELLSTLFGQFGKLNISDQINLERYIEREMNIQKDLVEVQKHLTEAQTEFIRAKTEKLVSGESLITIDGTNLEPELEAFMLRILQNIQIWANTEGQEFLLGVS